MAASKNTAALGKVSFATAKKLERRCGVYVAQRERRYNPNAATDPEKTHVIIPGRSPADAMAWYVNRYGHSNTISWQI